MQVAEGSLLLEPHGPVRHVRVPEYCEYWGPARVQQQFPPGYQRPWSLVLTHILPHPPGPQSWSRAPASAVFCPELHRAFLRPHTMGPGLLLPARPRRASAPAAPPPAAAPLWSEHLGCPCFSGRHT